MANTNQERTRRIRRYVIEEDPLGNWNLRLYFNRGKQRFVRLDSDWPDNPLDFAKRLSLNQPLEPNARLTKIGS